TVTQLAQATGLSRPTVESVLTGLCERNIATDLGYRLSDGPTVGRPARRYGFENNSHFFVGAYLGPTTLHAWVASFSGEILHTLIDSYPHDCLGHDRLAHLALNIHTLLHQAGADPARVLAAGVSLPGMIDAHGTVVTTHVIPDLTGVQVRSILEDHLNFPITVDNDVRLASLAEHRIGAAHNHDDALYLHIADRQSAGLILGGKIRKGHHGAAGEIGGLLAPHRVNHQGHLLWPGGLTTHEVFSRALNGNRAAKESIASYAADISTPLASLVMGVDPDVVVIGGLEPRAIELLISRLQPALQAAIPLPITPVIVPSQLGHDGVVLGALVAALSRSDELTGIPEPGIVLPQHG
ncbi:MAG TPA: ROK family protein, partial [Beutenbergiaceae bacterium]|nr:ROK family protein [Beutenbergiaceae bacterium]